jgi:hypothetical protein
MEGNKKLKCRQNFKLKRIKTNKVNVWNFYTKVFEKVIIYNVITEVFNLRN